MTGTVDPGASVAERYASIAGMYDRLWSPVIRPFALPVFAEIGAPGARVALDVGCGTGAHARDLHEAAPTATIVGADRSEAMLAHAVRGRDVAGTVSDAARLPFASGSVDLAVCVFMLQHCPDPHAVVAEMARVVRPGGLGASVTWGPDSESHAETVWAEMLDDAGVPPSERGTDTSDRFETVDLARDAWQAAGGSVARAWTLQRRHTFGFDELWEILTVYGRSSARLERMDPEARRALLEAAHRRFTSLPPDSFAWRAEVVYCVARV